MRKLAITTKTTLRRSRNEGLIKYTQPKHKWDFFTGTILFATHRNNGTGQSKIEQIYKE